MRPRLVVKQERRILPMNEIRPSSSPGGGRRSLDAATGFEARLPRGACDRKSTSGVLLIIGRNS